MSVNEFKPHIGAIQIIQSLEEENDKTGEKQHVIRVMENHENGLRLQDILCGRFKNLPIFVFSICGKTRCGKSFLLNLMIKYLESQGSKKWTDGAIPKVFDWIGGHDSLTKGIWVCPYIYTRINKDGKQVGILLMDSQGMFDGEQTDGELTALSGISTALSFCQMFNLKEKICTSDLEGIWRHLIIDNSNLIEDSTATRLLFIVRDYADDDECGLDHGEAYIEAEKSRGTGEHKVMWQSLQQTFPHMQCLLLPHPGLTVWKGKVKEMKDCSEEFLKECERFFSKIFSAENLIITKNVLNGEKVYRTLLKFNGSKADDSLSFVKVYTEHGNQSKLENLLDTFELRRKSVLDNSSEYLNSLMEDIFNSAKEMFKGNSAEAHLLKLKKIIMTRINLSMKDDILENYESMLTLKGSHVSAWKSVNESFVRFVGPDLEKNDLKEDIIIGCARHYYKVLREEIEPQFSSSCKDKSLVQLQGHVEIFLSNKFQENNDFLLRQSTKQACRAIWLEERNNLRLVFQDRLLDRVEALTKVDKRWLVDVTETQLEFLKFFTWNENHWLMVNKYHDNLLEFIGYTLYKKSRELCDYTVNEMEKIKFIAEKVKSQSEFDTIKLSCIFIIYFHESTELCEPVYRVQQSSGQVVFVDVGGRVYTDWNHFERTNKLPDCLYCHPPGGTYDKRSGDCVAFSWSPASTEASRLLGQAKLAFEHAKFVRGVKEALGTTPKNWILSLLTPVTPFVGAVSYFPVKKLNFYSHQTKVKFLYMGNELSLFLMFNSKSPEGAIKNIMWIYDLPPLTSNLAVIQTFISKNSATFPSGERCCGERPSIRQFFPENFLLLLLVLMNASKDEERILPTIRDAIATSEDLKALENVLGEDSISEEQQQFVQELLKLTSEIIENKGQKRFTYQGINYFPVDEAIREVVLAGLCSGVCRIVECLSHETTQQFVSVMKEVLRFVCDKATTRNIVKLTVFLKTHCSEIVTQLSS